MQFNSSSKAMETWIEGFFKYLVSKDMAHVCKDGYNPSIDNSLYTRIYKVHTVPEETKATFRYDKRENGDTAYIDIPDAGLHLIFEQLSFYTILDALGIKLFKDDRFDKDSLKILSDKIFEITGKRIEIKVIE